MAAHMHDIGKIGVPDEVLAKKGALTEAEWQLVRRHPQIGCDILSPLRGVVRNRKYRPSSP